MRQVCIPLDFSWLSQKATKTPTVSIEPKLVCPLKQRTDAVIYAGRFSCSIPAERSNLILTWLRNAWI